jgi:hypothetical protein
VVAPHPSAAQVSSEREFAWFSAVLVSAVLTALTLLATLVALPLLALISALCLAASGSIAVLVLTEIVVGSGMEWEEQYVTPGEKTRYDRYNYFLPSIRSLPRLIGVLGISVVGVVVGFGGLFAAIERQVPGSFSSLDRAWFYFSAVTFATVLRRYRSEVCPWAWVCDPRNSCSNALHRISHFKHGVMVDL